MQTNSDGIQVCCSHCSARSTAFSCKAILSSFLINIVVQVFVVQKSASCLCKGEEEKNMLERLWNECAHDDDGGCTKLQQRPRAAAGGGSIREEVMNE